jgi:hypothetical protein
MYQDGTGNNVMKMLNGYSSTNGKLARTIGSLAVLVALGTCTSSAWAQGTAAAAEALFQQGRDEMAKGNYDSACGKLRQSDELDPALGTKLNLADCESKRGKLATAWELFKAVEQKLDPSDSRHAIAKQKRAAIEPQLPKLVLVLAQGAPPNTTVREGTAVLGSTAFGIELPLDPGQHELLVSAPDRTEMKYTVKLEPGKITKVEVAPGAAVAAKAAPIMAAPAPVTPAAPAGPTDTRDSKRTRTTGYVLGGIGVAGLVVGGVAGALTLGAKNTNDSHCNATLHVCDSTGRDAASSGRVFGVMTTAGLAVGVVGIGLGTYFLVKGSKSTEPQTAIMMQTSPAGAQLSLVRQW